MKKFLPLKRGRIEPALSEVEGVGVTKR